MCNSEDFMNIKKALKTTLQSYKDGRFRHIMSSLKQKGKATK